MMSMIGKACLLLPYIILEFLQLLGFGACIILTVGDNDDNGGNGDGSDDNDDDDFLTVDKDDNDDF